MTASVDTTDPRRSGSSDNRDPEDFPEAVVDAAVEFLGKPRARGWIHVYSAVIAAIAGAALLTRFTRVTVLRTSLAIAAIGILTVVLVPGPVPMIVGTILWGLGSGVCWPITISAAADRHETAARDVATVSAIGYTSMLLGPMAFGVLGEQIGLLPALIVLPIFVVLGISLASVTREPMQ